MTDTVKPLLRESLEVIYADERRETIIVKRLSNTDMIKWADTGLDKAFLVFRSVEFSSAGVSPANQSWFDSLTQDSAFAVVEKALALNHSPIQKKMHGGRPGKPAVVVVSDALDFLRARGHDTDKLTDYEIEETFTAAFKNWQHGLVETAFYTGLPWITKPRDWKKYCDDLHRADRGDFTTRRR